MMIFEHTFIPSVGFNRANVPYNFGNEMRTTTMKNPVVHGIEELNDTHTLILAHKYIHPENREGRKSGGDDEKREK